MSSFCAKDAVGPTEKSWKNSIRHNLSLHSKFVRVHREQERGKWTIAEGVDLDHFQTFTGKISQEMTNRNSPVIFWNSAAQAVYYQL